MASIRSKNTKPELAIRKILWSHGIRYRIHDNGVFGKPDISIKKHKVAVFIDGCFWHACKKCYTEPKTNTTFWRKKIQENKMRREKVRKNLKENNWKIMEFWEHDIRKKPELVTNKIEYTIRKTRL